MLWRETCLPFLSLFKGLPAGLAPWVEQVLGHIRDFWRDRKCRDPSLPQSSCPAEICCSFVTWLPEVTHLPWCGCKHCTCGPTESPFMEHLSDCDDHRKPNKLSESTSPPKTRQSKAKQKIFILNDQEYIKSSSDVFGAGNSFQPSGGKWACSRVSCYVRPGLRVKTEKGDLDRKCHHRGLFSAATDPDLQSHCRSRRNGEWTGLVGLSCFSYVGEMAIKQGWQTLMSTEASSPNEQNSAVQETREVKETELRWRAHTLCLAPADSCRNLGPSIAFFLFIFLEKPETQIWV